MLFKRFYQFSLLFVFSITILTSGCVSKSKLENKEQLVFIETTLGNIKIKLYNTTPLHRDNFLKLVNEGYYDGTLFHRVIKEFMVQGGDPDSKTAKSGDVLGNGGPEYTIPAEFRPGLFHKKGALAAARKSDQVNPEKRSSGSQFYIVQGKVFTDEELDKIEDKINNMLKQSVFFKFVEDEKKKALENDGKIDYSKVQEAAALKTEEEFLKMKAYTIPPEQRQVYKTSGGTPHLDQNYTVFGQVVEGLEVIDKITLVKTDERDRALEDIKILQMKTVKK